MRKIIIALVISIMLSGCAEMGKMYNYAIVYAPAGEVLKEGDIKSYSRGSRTINVTFTDGEQYFTSNMNVVLISTKDDEYYINQEGEHDT